MYGCELEGMRVFKKRLLWKIFRPKREEELIGEGRKLYNENLSGFYSFNIYGNDQIKENVMSRACGMYRRRQEVHVGF